jgi:hypothetical protein
MEDAAVPGSDFDEEFCWRFAMNGHFLMRIGRIRQPAMFSYRFGICNPTHPSGRATVSKCAL